MALSALTIDEVAQSLLTCVCAALDHTAVLHPTLAGCPTCRVCTVPGTVVWDGCDGGCSATGTGQLSVSVAGTYPSTFSTFPAEDRQVRDARVCLAPVLAVEYVITLLRCAPVADSQTGCPPSCEALSASAAQVHADLFTLHQAALCCTPQTSDVHNGRRFVMGRSRVLGPEGGCVGIEQRLTLELPGCDPCTFVQVP